MHFYENTENGVEPRHYVPMVSRPEELRPTRITDVRKWWKEDREVVPSVTTILNVLDKSGLTNWKIDQHLKQSFKLVFGLAQGLYYSEEDLLAETKRLTELEMDIAPSAGTDFHKLMEQFINCNEGDPEQWNAKDWNLCDAVLGEIKKQAQRPFHFYPEVNFASEKYGGQVDLIINNQWIIDYKTKQTTDKFKPGKMAYQDHSMQLAAYRKAVSPKARCANVFVCLEDGQIDFHEHSEEELEKGWKLFEHALGIWWIQNGVSNEPD